MAKLNVPKKEPVAKFAMKEPVKKAKIDTKRFNAANLASSSDTETESDDGQTRKSKATSARHSVKA